MTCLFFSLSVEDLHSELIGQHTSRLFLFSYSDRFHLQIHPPCIRNYDHICKSIFDIDMVVIQMNNLILARN